MTLVATAALLTLLATCGPCSAEDGSFPETSESYVHRAEMDTRGRYFLFWKFDDESITFEVHVHTRGWVGLGLSSNGAMHGADLFLGRVLADGRHEFMDAHGVKNNALRDSRQQDWSVLLASRTGNVTTFKLNRKLETCDDDDFPILEGTSRVLFAWGDQQDAFGYHGSAARGSKSLLLLEHSITDDANVHRQLQHVDLVVENVHLPAKRTTYFCKIVRAPTFSTDGKKHVVRVEPVITSGREGVVHHMIVYSCIGAVTADVYGHECWADNMPDNATTCSRLSFAWAVGQRHFVLPRDAGFSVNAPSDAKFFMLEIHYDNPEGRDDIDDSSGLRLFYTDSLREYDAGTISFGHTVALPRMVVPPGQSDYRVDGYCGSSCTRKSIPPGGINVFAALPHTHLLGRRIRTQQIRDGIVIGDIVREDHYDFNYQQTRRLHRNINILPGDEFKTSCWYDSSSRRFATLGGPGTDEEMCLTFVAYYPSIDLQSCESTTQTYQPIRHIVMKKALLGNATIVPNHAKGGLDKVDDAVYKLLRRDEMHWLPSDVQYLRQKLDNGPKFHQTCRSVKDTGSPLEGNYEAKPHVPEHLKRKSRCPQPEGDANETTEVVQKQAGSAGCGLRAAFALLAVPFVFFR